MSVVEAVVAAAHREPWTGVTRPSRLASRRGATRVGFGMLGGRNPFSSSSWFFVKERSAKSLA